MVSGTMASSDFSPDLPLDFAFRLRSYGELGEARSDMRSTRQIYAKRHCGTCIWRQRHLCHVISPKNRYERIEMWVIISFGNLTITLDRVYFCPEQAYDSPAFDVPILIFDCRFCSVNTLEDNVTVIFSQLRYSLYTNVLPFKRQRRNIDFRPAT